MNNIINFGTISRSNVRYNSSLTSIKYIKNVLINIANSLAGEYSDELLVQITGHVTDEFLQHAITEGEIYKRSINMILDDIFTELMIEGVYTGDKDQLINTIIGSLNLYQGPESSDSSIFDTVTFNEVFDRMLKSNNHTSLMQNLNDQIAETPRELIQYVEGNYANYALLGDQLLATYEEVERSYVSSLSNPGTYIDFESHPDDALYSVLSGIRRTKFVDMSMYGEGTIGISRKHMNYYEEPSLFDVRNNPSTEQLAHTANLRKVSEYAKVHNVVGLDETVTVILSIDMRHQVSEPVDIINLTGRSKSQMALMLHPDRIVLELDAFDVNKTMWVLNREPSIPILDISITFDNGNVRIVSYDANGDLVISEIYQESRSYFENILYLFICPYVGTYKSNCVRIGKVEIYGNDVSNEDIEILLNQRGVNQ